MICPNCRRTHENVRGKCPHCGADFHGNVREKRAVQPRELGPKYRCAHGILLHRPCSKCERSNQDCGVYRRSVLNYLKGFFEKSEADKRANDMLSAIDLIEGQKGM